MSFTTRCFIRKNSKELQKKLADIGYNVCTCVDFMNAKWLNTLPINGTIHGKGYFDAEMELPDWTVEKELTRFVIDNPSSIDCGENEELFLAIAALRDDSDIHQWFIIDIEAYLNIHVGDWFIATDRIGGKHVGTQIEPLYCHKATVEELIKNFEK